MTTLVFFLEEPSAREMLKGVLPRIVSEEFICEFKIFEGKQDLEKRLCGILRAWRKPHPVFMILQDQDSGNCVSIKEKLVGFCKQSGKEDALVRVACRELESFYLGDLMAVEKGLGLNGVASKQNNKKFRDPDRLGNPSEELFKLTEGLYQKISGSRAISPYLDLSKNRSHSFLVLLEGIRRITGGI